MSFLPDALGRPAGDHRVDDVIRLDSRGWNAPNRAKVYSLRPSQKVRAIAYQDGDFLRLLSLHPENDSAYER